MKSATTPPLHLASELRQDIESVLEDGETLSSFAEKALRKQISSRKLHQDFIARGLAARDQAKVTGSYVSKHAAMNSLETILKKAKESL